MAKITNINLRITSHILQLIFSKLSMFKLPMCRIVCRTWNDLVLDCSSKLFPITSIICTDGIQHSNLNHSFVERLHKPKLHVVDFDQMHLRGMNLDPSFGFEDSCSIVNLYSSCNGLLFVSKFSYDAGSCIGILNPMTNEFMSVPIVFRLEKIYCYGFGFSLNRNYIIARVYFDMPKECSFLEIFTFGSNIWRRAHCFAFVVFQSNGVYFNEALYWIGKHVERNTFAAYRLDVERLNIEETFLSETGSSRVISFSLLRGSLYATFLSRSPPYKIQIWVMQSFGGKQSWNREFVIDDISVNWVLSPYRNTFYFKIIKVDWEDGNVWCVINDMKLFVYNSKTKMGRMQVPNQIYQNRRVFLWACEIESFNFSSLQKILMENNIKPTGMGKHVPPTHQNLGIYFG